MIHAQESSLPQTERGDATSTLAVWVRPAFLVGGTLWIVYYALWLGHGLLTGETQGMNSTIGTIITPLFCGALVGITAGLFGLADALQASARKLALTGMIVGGLAGLFAIAALLLLVSGIADRPGALGGFSVIGTCLSATLLGIAAVRSRATGRGLAWLLLLTGALTFPLVVALGALVGTLAPGYVLDELPFAISGAAWVMIGRGLGREE